MHRSRRRVYTVILVFAVILLIGVVYATTTGVLNFGGTARLNTNMKLIIIDEVIVDEDAGEAVSVNAAGDTLSFTVRLDKPGDTKYIKFKIENVGNGDAVLGTLSHTPPASNSGITVTWPSLNTVQVLHGVTSSEYTIEVHWNSAYPEAMQDVSLSATINYSQYTS